VMPSRLTLRIVKNGSSPLCSASKVTVPPLNSQWQINGCDEGDESGLLSGRLFQTTRHLCISGSHEVVMGNIVEFGLLNRRAKQ
jgi:hypothetical protein